MNSILILGQQLTVGDEKGNLYVYDVHENLTSCRPDEWSKLSRYFLNNLSFSHGECLAFVSVMTLYYLHNLYPILFVDMNRTKDDLPV